MSTTTCPYYVVKRIQALLNEHRKPVNGSMIVVLGLSYIPNTDDGVRQTSDLEDAGRGSPGRGPSRRRGRDPG